MIIDSLLTQRYPTLFNMPSSPEVSFIDKNLNEVTASDVRKFGDFDHLIHLAATTDAAGNASNSEALFKNNLGATRSAISLCMEIGSSLIFPSSTSVYGSQESLVDENCKDLNPQSPYAECKLEEEGMIQEEFRNGLKAVILRLGTIHGVSKGMRFHTAVNKFCFQAVMGQPLSVWKTALNQFRPYLSLTDADAAFSHVIEQKLFDGQVFNVLTDNHTVSEIVSIITANLNNPPVIDFVDSPIMNQLSYEVDSAKITNTGLSVSGSIEFDIQETLRLLGGIQNARI